MSEHQEGTKRKGDADRVANMNEHNAPGEEGKGKATRQMPIALPHLWVFFSSNITLVDREWTQSCISLL
jgi:hypothetical protein